MGIRSSIRLLSLQRPVLSPHLICWHHCLTPNFSNSSVPLVSVSVRKCPNYDPSEPFVEISDLGSPTRRTIPGNFLGKFRMGATVMLKTATDLLKVSHEVLDVNFSSNGWCFEKAATLLQTSSQGGIPWLEGIDLDGWLINFHLDDGAELYVPCFEYFGRCYGLNSELHRVLLTYPWQEVERRIFRPPGRHLKAPKEFWHVDLGPKMRREDAVFLAHIRYDRSARDQVKRLYAEREARWVEDRGDTAFKAGPWHEGPGQLKVRGQWISPGSFLGIRVDGISDPIGPPVSYTSAERPDRIEGAIPKTRLESTTLPRFRPSRAHGELPVHADRGPDPTTGYSVAESSRFQVLGNPRKVQRLRGSTDAGSSSQSYTQPEKPQSFATGEPGESGSGIGELAIVSPVVFAGEGVLLDIWKALRRLREEFPSVLEIARWFSVAEGFGDGDPPNLNAVPTPSPPDQGSRGSARGWHWINPGAKLDDAVPRGVLAIHIRANGRDFCVLEIERRPRGIDKEEQFTGLAFPLEHPDELGIRLAPILSVLSDASGVFSKILQSCPDGSAVFRHGHAPKQRFACEAAARNALKKMGVNLSPASG